MPLRVSLLSGIFLNMTQIIRVGISYHIISSLSNSHSGTGTIITQIVHNLSQYHSISKSLVKIPTPSDQVIHNSIYGVHNNILHINLAYLTNNQIATKYNKTWDNNTHSIYTSHIGGLPPLPLNTNVNVYVICITSQSKLR